MRTENYIKHARKNLRTIEKRKLHKCTSEIIYVFINQYVITLIILYGSKHIANGFVCTITLKHARNHLRTYETTVMTYAKFTFYKKIIFFALRSAELESVQFNY